VRINEIFRSLQGESTYAGLPCTFIRLTGCNLTCAWCDTTYAWDQGSEWSVPEIVRTVRQHGLDLVEITGGEPLLQSETPELAQRLLETGATVLVETNGSVDIDRLPLGCIRIMDLKTPSSAMCGHMDWSNVEKLQATDQVKFLIADQADWLWSVDKVKEHELLQRCAVLVSAVYSRVAYAQLAEWILASGLALRLQLQMHKHIWPPDQRGV
jgi:7-carboxy-7-deazaguanine synthase